ncbi:hypothetical protein D3C87_2142940 [compost metagenome]
MALLGMIFRIGIRNNAGMNNNPVTNGVKPERPPAAIPAAPSAAVVVGLQPSIEAAIIDREFA